jgi:transcriptional regulator with XRE-family HTH domain
MQGMEDIRVGAAFRAVRTRRRWRQQDVAERAGVSRAFVSLAERGHLDRVSLRTIRRIAAVLDIRIDVVARWRGGELDRLLSGRHSALAESVAATFIKLPGWSVAPEVSFSIYGERGIIDLLAFHEPSGTLLVIELKTAIVDVNELVGNVDRKRRLAARIAAERGWRATSVSSWIIVAAGTTNRRRVTAHRTMLRAAYPHGGRAMHAWIRRPVGRVAGLSMWSSVDARSARMHRRGPGTRSAGLEPSPGAVAGLR